MKCNDCKIETLKAYDDGLCQSCHKKAYKKAYYQRVTKPKRAKEKV